MICYKDRTFCTFHEECKTPCDRALTEEVKIKANGAGLLISHFVDKPECFTPKEVKNDS